jgi:putative oxidoreductase
MSLQSSLTRWEPYAHGVFRIITGLLFLEHGAQKFLSFPAGKMSGSGWTFATAGSYGGVVELIAGILITLGWFTRSAAFIASGEMAVAYWMVHARQDFFPVNNMGDAAVLFCFVFLYFVFAGPGALSIDGQKSYVEVTDSDRR